MTKKKIKDAVPQLDLKGEDFKHEVPEKYSLTLFIQWRDSKLEREELSRVCFFEKEGKEFRVVNKNNPTLRYCYNLDEVRKVFILFDVEGGES